MKVLEIKDFKRKSDNKPYWRVELEGSEIPLLSFSKPEFAIGTEIDVGNLKASKDGKYYTLIRPKEEGTTTRKSYGKSPEEMESIERQVDKKIASELYRHHISPDVPFDKAELTKIYNACHSLGKNPIVEEAKKMGAEEI